MAAIVANPVLVVMGAWLASNLPFDPNVDAAFSSWIVALFSLWLNRDPRVSTVRQRIRAVLLGLATLITYLAVYRLAVLPIVRWEVHYVLLATVVLAAAGEEVVFRYSLARRVRAECRLRGLQGASIEMITSAVTATFFATSHLATVVITGHAPPGLQLLRLFASGTMLSLAASSVGLPSAITLHAVVNVGVYMGIGDLMSTVNGWALFLTGLLGIAMNGVVGLNAAGLLTKSAEQRVVTLKPGATQ